MGIFNDNNIGVQVQANFKMSEEERLECEKREEMYRKQHEAKEAVLILNFILNPPVSNSLYGVLGSMLAKKVGELCVSAIAECKD